MSLRYILTRAFSIILVVVCVLYLISFVKNKRREGEIVSELKSLSSESSFFHQFSAEAAEKSLVRAVGLIAEAKKIGLDPEHAIDRGLGIEEKYFAMDTEETEHPPGQNIIRSTLRANYENFRKLGYTADFHTLQSMKKGELPPVRIGPLSGSKAEVGTIIDPALSPGLDAVMANLEIRPKRDSRAPLTDIQTAAAKRLASELYRAGVIEESASKRIIAGLSGEEPEEGEPVQPAE